MTTFAPHRDTVEHFVDSMHGGADKAALSEILAEDVLLLYGPLGDEPISAARRYWKPCEPSARWRPLPSGVEMQGHLAGVIGGQSWELPTDKE